MMKHYPELEKLIRDDCNKLGILEEMVTFLEIHNLPRVKLKDAYSLEGKL